MNHMSEVKKSSVKKNSDKKNDVKAKDSKKDVLKKDTVKGVKTKKKVTSDIKDKSIKEQKLEQIKLDKSKMIMMVCFIIIAALTVLLGKINIRNNSRNTCKYTLSYDDEQTPGAMYEMCVSKNKDIIVTRKPKDEKEGVTIENINFKEENKKYIDIFIERYIGKKKKVNLKISDIYLWSNEDKVIFQAVLYNDEEFLSTLN